MNRRILPVLLLAAAALVTMAVHAAASILGANEVLKLPSGRTAKILSVSKVESSKGVMALMVRYQTTLSMDEAKAVSQEVDEVWKFAQIEVERDGYGEAIICSDEIPHGVFITSNREANFLFERGSDGKWTRLNRGDFMAAQ